MDFIDTYIEYRKQTEPPYIYHRWAAISAIAAALGRNMYFPFGDQRIFPNLYIMLIGEPAARKSTAIKQMKGILQESGYDSFAADKTRQEKFLMDLAGVQEDGSTQSKTKGFNDTTTLENLWGSAENSGNAKEVYIASDEFSDFTPPGSGEFYTLLGNLWDYDEEKKCFTHRLKNSVSLEIFQPTINILGGITPELFSKTFPPEIIGTGFLSRMIMIHGERSKRKYTIPPKGNMLLKERLAEHLQNLRTVNLGEVSYSEDAYDLLDRLYNGWEELDDVRFRSYSSRRFTQLIKLCLIYFASSFKAGQSAEITPNLIIRANTTLTAAERIMPLALGEFGKNKNSAVQNVIMEMISNARKPLTITEIWPQVMKDIEKIHILSDIMMGLRTAGKIQQIAGTAGFLACRKVGKAVEHVDWSLLTQEEREGL